MPGIKGMKTKKNHEDSPRFAEYYYQKEHPECTIEQCEEKQNGLNVLAIINV